MLVPLLVCKREDGAVREKQRWTPSPSRLPTVFLHATHDNRLGGHVEHTPAPAQPVWRQPVPGPTRREERCRLPTVKASLPLVRPDWEQDPGAAAAAGGGDVVQAPLWRERQLEHGPGIRLRAWDARSGHQAESLGCSAPPACQWGAGHSVG